jgi:hypothetical protein
MKIWIYRSESNSWIYFYMVLNKNWKIDWSQPSIIGLGAEDQGSSWGLLTGIEHLSSPLFLVIRFLLFTYKYKRDLVQLFQCNRNC